MPGCVSISCKTNFDQELAKTRRVSHCLPYRSTHAQNTLWTEVWKSKQMSDLYYRFLSMTIIYHQCVCVPYRYQHWIH